MKRIYRELFQNRIKNDTIIIIRIREDNALYTGKYFIEKMGMVPHPEGGYYKENVKSDQNLTEERKLWSSTYFLLKDRDFSAFHRLKSDEIWYYHSGTPLMVYIIKVNGELEQVRLGLDIERGEKPQILLPKGCIFGAIMDGTGYSLFSCMVSPGYDFDDFELLSRDTLLEKYPQYAQIIRRLTR